LFVGLGEDVIPPQSRTLFLKHRLHGTLAPPPRPHATLSDASLAEQGSLALLQSTAVPLESVFYLWPQCGGRLDRLLKWLPKAPLCPKTKSFILRFLHKKTHGLLPRGCPHCLNESGFEHEQFDCRLSFAAFVLFCKQMSAWLDIPLRTLAALQQCLLHEIPRDRPQYACWNISIWLFRRALFTALTVARIGNNLLNPADVVSVWKSYVSEFVGVISRSRKHASRYACNGRWLQENQPGVFTSVLVFLP
jgi:hypothetical protein